MDVRNEQRTGDERREFALYYRYGHERRNNTGNRRLDTAEALRSQLQPFLTGGMAQGYAASADRDVAIKTIAQAFGIHPDSLETIEHDDLVDSSEICQSCKVHARSNAELKNELTESRNDVERYKNQLKDLLLSFNDRRQ